MQNSLISRMKYYYDLLILKRDQDGILHRYLNEKENWDKHLVNCKQCIINNSPKGKTIAILGSGWLLDVPMDELLKQYDHIHLYDIIHPRQIQHKYRTHSNVKFIKIDLTAGLIELVSKSSTTKLLFERIMKKQWCINLSTYDAVVSLNILNQLDILIIDLLKRKHSFSLDEQVQIRAKIQTDHLLGLPENKSLLISDCTEISQHILENKIESKNLIHANIAVCKEVNAWDWLFDTRGMYRENHSTTFKVKAFVI